MKLTSIIWYFPWVSVVAAVHSTDGADFSSRDFDYIVIGGGTAGLVVAARLSENPKVSVGVIEAGPYFENDPLINTPALAGRLQGNSTYDWMFSSVPQSHVNNRSLPMPRGKALGGSSAINLMALDRASKIEYDAWEKLGNPKWNWNGLLPYMKAAERFTTIDPFRANATDADTDDIFPSQGTKGPIAASFNTWYSDIVTPYREALANLNIPINYNPDSGNPYGLYNSATAVNRTTGTRSYAANTYFAYNSARPNFFVLTEAQATKIEFSKPKSDKNRKIKATGVSFVHNSTLYIVKAKKEVILSAGAFQTPQLLELSGIGNSSILGQNGIAALVDLPGVGENLQDHLLIPSTYELKPGPTTLDILRNNATYAADAQAQYAATHDGIYTASTSTLAFINLDYIATPEELSSMISKLDHEVDISGATKLQKAQYLIQKDWLKKKVGSLEIVLTQAYGGTGTPKANTSYASVQMVIQHPFSRGSVHINSSDPLAKPEVDPNYFTKSIDQEILVQALKFGLKVSETEPLASFVIARQDPPPETSSSEAYIDYIKANVRTIFHPIGTAALAPRAIGGVVDPFLKVYGTSNVRVVDASIIPIHMGTHISRTVYGIGERGAAMITENASQAD
ncbi:Glucose oxidase OS=Talaromyces flavus GN=GOX PE=3 SV=1 [Rhizoctonia solani AG-1 IB]|uniref:Glucose oxidase n=1 Tax=Thanatephorus cucumeris (strain AG1-IB / isolate 7/3/14) TaxID=1108050 RepID=A0A0B7FPB3_THACB|nr:Glucose oxidase OS=Talaromyces flavus GN=GOX PE=3 SV=1 [Rhizoctonia solani AG-1 IB]